MNYNFIVDGDLNLFTLEITVLQCAMTAKILVEF